MSFTVCKVIRGIQAQIFSLNFFHLPVLKLLMKENPFGLEAVKKP